MNSHFTKKSLLCIKPQKTPNNQSNFEKEQFLRKVHISNYVTKLPWSKWDGTGIKTGTARQQNGELRYKPKCTWSTGLSPGDKSKPWDMNSLQQVSLGMPDFQMQKIEIGFCLYTYKN
jgi:hypothetical protein